MSTILSGGCDEVSTHSRPKAAGEVPMQDDFGGLGFNTQPPEGGWVSGKEYTITSEQFQHTAARRRLG